MIVVNKIMDVSGKLFFCTPPLTRLSLFCGGKILANYRGNYT